LNLLNNIFENCQKVEGEILTKTVELKKNLRLTGASHILAIAFQADYWDCCTLR